MIRPVTITALVLTAVLSYGLYELKDEVRGREAELRALKDAVAEEKESLRVLAAEWSYLNRPDRLAAMAGRYLELVPLKAGQVQGLDAIPLRDPEPTPLAGLPAVGPESAVGEGATRFVGGVAVPVHKPRPPSPGARQ